MSEDKSLLVRVLKDGELFLEGNFDVRAEDYGVVKGLLKEVDLTDANAASMLSGYMHASDVGKASEEMGKLAMIAAVHILEQGKTAIEVPL